MRRRLAAVGVLASALCMVVPAAVSAHADRSSIDCDGLHVNLRAYETPPEGQANTVTVIIDGDERYHDTFDVNINTTYEIGEPFEAHTVLLEVRAWDDPNGVDVPDASDGRSWSFDREFTIGACQEPTPRPTPEPTPEPTPRPTPKPTPTPDGTDRPDRTPRPTPRATEGRPPTLPPNLDLPPTDTAGDYGMTGGDSQGAGQGILFLLAVMAAAGSTYGIRTVRRRAAAKR